MAKKEKAPEADAEGEGENPAAEGAVDAAPKKGLGKILGLLKNKKVLMIGAPVLLLLLGGIGAGVYFFVLKPHGAEKKPAEEVQLTPPQVAFDDVDDLLVNIQSPDATTPAYLKLSVSLELDNDLQKTGVTALMPRIKDQFQAYLRELRVDDLKGSGGVLRMKEELLRRVNVAAAPYKVRDVLLKQMIVQ
jgi:flagellar FliL protein